MPHLDPKRLSLVRPMDFYRKITVISELSFARKKTFNENECRNFAIKAFLNRQNLSFLSILHNDAKKVVLLFF